MQPNQVAFYSNVRTGYDREFYIPKLQGCPFLFPDAKSLSQDLGSALVSWVWREALGEQHFNYYDKPLLLLFRGKEQRDKIIQTIYYTLRFSLKVPTYPTTNGNPLYSLAKPEELDELWGTHWNFIDISRVTNKQALSDLFQQVYALTFEMFENRGPLILVGSYLQRSIFSEKFCQSYTGEVVF